MPGYDTAYRYLRSNTQESGASTTVIVDEHVLGEVGHLYIICTPTATHCEISSAIRR
ncbi:hypothetical protein SNOG_07103 [Parastagonospora nodorum SN15]|uniref:Uncharacterized protein n=1 Tax=Phaeosphaeria nodorum (strain SN15 / ATCC MYA-4574 / FGSC 10173) TaxID=321614 RepID=Q0UMB1_PHANO|nr:hypothetical protein SNOG_07103 [Parastagonospora nodorum SN15]EAT85754.1 hypothetical protein SNOG_07103 [Parastagonospora nodorum SN15]